MVTLTELLVIGGTCVALYGTYQFLVWRDMTRKPKTLSDINDCLCRVRQRKNFREKASKVEYILNINDEMISPIQEVKSYLNILSSYHPLNDIEIILRDGIEIRSEYKLYIDYSNELNRWGRHQDKYPKPRHRLINFVFDSQNWCIEKFCGNTDIDDDGQIIYGYHEYQVHIGHQLMIQLRSYKRSSVSVLESHMDEEALADLSRIADLAHYLRKLKEAPGKRNSYRWRRREEDLKIRKHNEKLYDHRLRFEIFDRNKSGNSKILN